MSKNLFYDIEIKNIEYYNHIEERSRQIQLEIPEYRIEKKESKKEDQPKRVIIIDLNI